MFKGKRHMNCGPMGCDPCGKGMGMGIPFFLKFNLGSTPMNCCEQFLDFGDKEEAADFLKMGKHHLKKIKAKVEEKLKNLDSIDKDLDTTIQELEKMDPFDKEKFKEIINKKVRDFIKGLDCCDE
jgi:hypothetical protein